MALLVPGLFVICILMALIRITSKGPTIFKQKRVGLNGRVFTMYKMRSMRLDAEDGMGPAWSTKGDPRVTPLGRLLRDHHLDELPQLINVVRGDMDLFGPRPEDGCLGGAPHRQRPVLDLPAQRQATPRA